MPAVSVVLPTYNRAHLLGRAIASVLAQTWRDLELIVVDDGSSDDSAARCAACADPRLRYLRHPARRGAAAARNTGIAASRAPAIAFQDSDDEWHPAKLERQLARLARAPAGTAVVYCRLLRVGAGPAARVPSAAQALAALALPTPARRLEGRLGAALARGNFISTQAALVRREALGRAGGFDEALPRFQDWDLWLRLAADYTFAYEPATLVTVHATPGNISSDPGAMREAFARLVARHGGGPYGSALAAQRLHALGRLSLADGHPEEAARQLAGAVGLSPLTAAYWAPALRALARAAAARRAERARARHT